MASDDIVDILKEIRDSLKNRGKSDTGSGGGGAGGKKKKEDEPESWFDRLRNWKGFKTASSAFAGASSGGRAAASGNAAGAAGGILRGGMSALGAITKLGPVGVAVGATALAVTALGAATVGAAVGITKFGQHLVTANQRLGDYNATIALSTAQASFRQMKRDFESGSVRAASTSALQGSLENLYDQIRPLQDLISVAFSTMANWGVKLVSVVIDLMKTITPLYNLMKAIYEWWTKKKFDDDKIDLFPWEQFINNIAAGDNDKHRDGRFRFDLEDTMRGKKKKERGKR